MNYKLLKILPGHNKGAIHTKKYWEKWFKEHKFTSQLDNLSWFESLKPLRWVICIKHIEDWYIKNKVYEVSSINGYVYDENNDNPIHHIAAHSKEEKYFRAATEPEIIAHRQNIHIDDKVWFKYKGVVKYIGEVASFKKTIAGVFANFNGSESRNIVYLTTVSPTPKIITEEGTELYNDDKCWRVRKTKTKIYVPVFENWVGTREKSKYFTKKENAQQYFIEFQTKKRNTDKHLKEQKVPEWVICTKTHPSWRNTKLGAIFQIRQYNKKYGTYNIIIGPGGQNVDKDNLQYFREATLVEVKAYKLGFRIGNKIWNKLTEKFFGTICKFTVYNNVPQIHTSNILVYTEKYINGVWIDDITTLEPTLKIKQKGSDLDIDKTCDTCKWENAATEHIVCSRCILRDNKFKVIDNNWQPKEFEFEFEIGKWYSSNDESFCCTEIKENDTSFNAVFGYGFNGNNTWQEDSHFASTGNTRWRLADVNVIKDLLLTKAKKDYPIGTKTLCASHGSKTGSWKVKGYNFVNFQLLNSTSSYLFLDGKWAEIIKEPKKWDIGTYVVCIKNGADEEEEEYKVGDISTIHKHTGSVNKYAHTDFGVEFLFTSNFALNNVKWFATKEEAEKFADTLKPKLMLGNVEVTLLIPDNYSTVENLKPKVWTKKGSIEIQNWLLWYYTIVKYQYTSEFTEIKSRIQGINEQYNTIFHPNSKESNSIGCIIGISWKQINEITKAIKKL